MSNDLTTEEQQWVDSAGKALRASEDQLDMVTVARLRAARARALDALPSGAAATPWLWAGPAALATALMAWTLMPRSVMEPALAPPVNLAGVDALELLTDEQDPEFYQDLDLYLWLEEPGEGVDRRA